MPIDKVMQFIEEHLSVEEILELQELMDSDRDDLYIKVSELAEKVSPGSFVSK